MKLKYIAVWVILLSANILFWVVLVLLLVGPDR
jgi:hypothetical protein